ncbi:MAG: hypothetical protein WC358_08590 [Ignavibacteria bacterium]|jgi:hypothetical protein
MKDFYQTFQPANIAYNRKTMRELLEKKISKAKILLIENEKINEYPIGEYSLTPSNAAIELICEIGRLEQQITNLGNETKEIHKHEAFLLGLNTIFKGLTRTVDNWIYYYELAIQNSSTFYFSITPEKKEIK